MKLVGSRGDLQSAQHGASARLGLVLMLASVALVLAGCVPIVAAPRATTPRPSPSVTRPTVAAPVVLPANDLARITWEAYSIRGTERQWLDSGQTTYDPSRDLFIERRLTDSGETWWRKEIRLGSEFTLDASVHRKPRIDGFGLSINMPRYPDGFSWEWFYRVDASTFQKLQGSGRVSVRMQQGPGYEQVAAIVFLDDVVMRFQADPSAPPGIKSHEVVIYAGSTFRLAD